MHLSVFDVEEIIVRSRINSQGNEVKNLVIYTDKDIITLTLFAIDDNGIPIQEGKE